NGRRRLAALALGRQGTVLHRPEPENDAGPRENGVGVRTRHADRVVRFAERPWVLPVRRGARRPISDQRRRRDGGFYDFADYGGGKLAGADQEKMKKWPAHHGSSPWSRASRSDRSFARPAARLLRINVSRPM